MHTACTLTVSGGVYLVPEGVYLVLGGVLSPRGCLTGGLTWGGCLPKGGGRPGQVLPPPVNRMTDACENITLPQLHCGQ